MRTYLATPTLLRTMIRASLSDGTEDSKQRFSIHRETCQSLLDHMYRAQASFKLLKIKRTCVITSEMTKLRVRSWSAQASVGTAKFVPIIHGIQHECLAAGRSGVYQKRQKPLLMPGWKSTRSCETWWSRRNGSMSGGVPKLVV
jgi:hypothetical protein